MSKFLRYLITLFYITITITLQAQNLPTLVRFDYPEYIPVNSVFDASVVLRFNKAPQADLSYSFKKNKSIRVQAAYLVTRKNTKKIFVKVRKQKVTIVIPADDIKENVNLPLQVILKCSGKGNRRVEGNLFFNETENSADENTALQKIIRFYTPQISAGNALYFSDNSKLDIQLKNNNEIEKLYVEFWMKSETGLKNFFSVTQSGLNDTIINLSQNKFSFITIPLNEEETIRQDVFLGIKNWNYFGIYFSKDFYGTKIDLYVNSGLIYSEPVNNLNDLDELKFTFATNLPEEKFEIDRLKIWNYNNSIEFAQQNKNFTSVVTDSSTSLAEFNFDKKNELKKKTNNLKLKSKNLNYKKSDAPIFSRAPKLTVTIGSSYNSIVWYVQEFSKAEKFILEKAVDGEEYKNIYSADADDDPLKIYTYIDEVTNADEVSFYRIKQINKDSSEVISAEVKVGNKEITDFKVRQNYPNPFNPLTNIYVDVLTTTEIKVNIYDLVGNKVEQLYNGILPQGFHTFPFDGSNLPSGIYFYEVASPHGHIVKKMILTK